MKKFIKAIGRFVFPDVEILEKPRSASEIASDFKLVYMDTNVVSDLCKDSDLILKLIERYPPSKYLLAFSTFTFYEISKSRLYEKFLDVFSVYPSAILKSHVPVIALEVDAIAANRVDVNPVFIIPRSIKGGEKSNRSVLSQLMESHAKTTFKNTDDNTKLLLDEWSDLRTNPELSELFKGQSPPAREFVPKYKLYELKKRFFNGQSVDVDKEKLKRLRALEILAYGVYFKFVSDVHQTKKQSDVLDILIMTTAPHVDVFISEGNSIEILKKIKRQSSCLGNIELLNISELRKTRSEDRSSQK